MKTIATILLFALLALADGVRCPVCVKQNVTSRVTPDGSGSMTAAYISGFYDEKGTHHKHGDNTSTWGYSCSRGHKWQTVNHGSDCPAGDYVVKPEETQILEDGSAKADTPTMTGTTGTFKRLSDSITTDNTSTPLVFESIQPLSFDVHGSKRNGRWLSIQFPTPRGKWNDAAEWDRIFDADTKWSFFLDNRELILTGEELANAVRALRPVKE